MTDDTPLRKRILELLEFSQEDVAPQSGPSPTDRLIFETTYVDSERGVHGCQGRQERMIQALVDNHAALKSKETGLQPVWKGHVGGNVLIRSGKSWDGARWCTITVVLKCRVVFETPEEPPVTSRDDTAQVRESGAAAA